MEAFNRLAEADARVQAVERERDEALSQAAAAKMAKEEAEREAFVNQANAIKMAELNLRAHSEVVHLKRMLAEARGLRDSEVAQASQTARHKTLQRFLSPNSKPPSRRCRSFTGSTTSSCTYLGRELTRN